MARETILNSIYGPLVEKDGDQYYVCKMPYNDDVELLETVVKNIETKKLSYSRGSYNSKLEIYQDYMNAYYNGSFILGLNDPTRVWNDELARQGKLICKGCNQPKIMYYSPWCPMCETERMITSGVVIINILMFKYYILRKYGEEIGGKYWKVIKGAGEEHRNDSTFNWSPYWEDMEGDELEMLDKVITELNLVSNQKLTREDSFTFHQSW